MAEELKGTSDIRVNTINPGATRTQMRAKAYPGENPANICPAEDIMPLYVYLMCKQSQEKNRIELGRATEITVMESEALELESPFSS